MNEEDLINEKTILLQEIHHRVKNNFQIIISLVELQVVRHPENKNVFIDLINRIRSMSLIYENLLLSDNLNYIKFCEYTKILIDSIKTTTHNDINICIKYDEEILLNLEQATPVGIVINELVVNACKHAFNSTIKNKTISIKIEANNNKIFVYIDDNGIGINQKFLRNDSSTLGLNLVKMLIKEQLEGHLYIKNDSGTKIVMDFEKE